MSETLEQRLERHEGCKYTIYTDTEGIATVGIGHNLHKPLSRQAVEQIFVDDLADAKNECLHGFSWFPDLTEARQEVIVNMCFNLGMTRLLKFKKFLEAVSLDEYDRAADEMLSSLWAKQVKSRALELAELMRGG